MNTKQKQMSHLVSTVTSFLASATVLTRVYLAFVDLFLAKSAGIARATSAGEIIDAINTNTTIPAVIGHAEVDVVLASAS